MKKLKKLNNYLYPTGFWTECKSVFKIAWPMVLTELWVALFMPVSLIFAGHLDKESMDGAALAISLYNVTGVSIGFGLCTALDTLFSQSFGSTNKKRVGQYLQKGIFVINICLFPCWAIHLNAEKLLILLGQDPLVSRIAGQYISILIPGLFANYMKVCFDQNQYQILAKYLICQNIVYPQLIIGAIANASNAVLQYIFVYIMNFGAIGSAAAQAIGYWLMFSFTLLYIIFSRIYEATWDGWSLKHSLEGWGRVYKLAIPGMIMVCIEWWSFEVGIVLSGLLGLVEQASYSVTFQTLVLAYMLPLGVSIGVSVRVGQALGEGNANKARTAGNVGVTMYVCAAAVMAIIFIATYNVLPKLFTNDPEVIEAASALMPIFALFQLVDGLCGVQNGIIRGTGRQAIGSVLIGISYILGLPFAAALMFLTPLRVAGLWDGLLCAMVVECTGVTIFIRQLNWQKMVERAQERAGVTKVAILREDSFGELKAAGEEQKCLIDGKEKRIPLSLILKRLLLVSFMICIFVVSLSLKSSA